MPYSQDTYFDLLTRYDLVAKQFDEVTTNFLGYSEQNNDLKEIICYGLLRRLNTVRCCISNTFSIYPVEEPYLLREEERIDLTINLQAILIHASGVLDNLAIIWVSSHPDLKNNQLKKTNIRFGKRYKQVWRSFPSALKDELLDIDVLEQRQRELSEHPPTYTANYDGNHDLHYFHHSVLHSWENIYSSCMMFYNALQEISSTDINRLSI